MILKQLCGFAVALVAAAGCVNVDKSLGDNLIPDDQAYTFHTVTFDLDDIEMKQVDSLSGSSLYRIAFGSVRDELFGLSRHMSAFYLVPVLDTLDFGDPGTQVFKTFHVTAPFDTLSCLSPDQEYIIQNINVYALEQPIDRSKAVPELVYDASKRISKGIPLYNGKDSLSFDFNEEYGKKYFSITQEDLDGELDDYLAKFPGIVLSTDDPIGNGGRINMFKLPVDVYNSTMRGSFASLYFSAEYDGEPKDSVFYFYLGPADKYDLHDVTTTDVSTYPQIAYNLTEHSSKSLEGEAGEVMYFEGGRGIKPVIKARSIRSRMVEEIAALGGKPESVVINRASLSLPFVFPDNYEDMLYYPTTLSPTVRVRNSETGKVSFGSISDTSVSEEDPGTVNRSLCKYSPDITHHLQQMLRNDDLSTIDNYDIWFLAMADETVTTTTSANDEYAEYYKQLAYDSYYSQMYGGYGGYGGYGYGYDNYYSNYYNYMMMAQMASSSTSSTTTQSMMDPNRYYRATLKGPAATDARPQLTVVFAIPVEE